jgi:hypothetical protein
VTSAGDGSGGSKAIAFRRGTSKQSLADRYFQAVRPSAMAEHEPANVDGRLSVGWAEPTFKRPRTNTVEWP